MEPEPRSCPGCNEANRPEARFCDHCGTALALSCPACSSELRAQARFCDGCGAPVATAAIEAAAPDTYTPRHLADKILTSRSALEGERKQVTVFFADVKGSIELSSAVDPEVWHEIMDNFFQVLTDGVHRFEGTVNQYTGDGVMALFGAPIAHEDHAQRACYAALRLRTDLAEQAREVKREHGLNFSTRIGLHSGEVVVGKIGDDLRMDYTAQGLTVGLASRMEDLASPDTIYMSEATAKLVSGYLDLEDLGEFPVKGLDQPMRVHQLLGQSALRTRFDVSRARGLTRFVGRDNDIQALESALQQSIAGSGQIVGVVAEAGTGKSRLCFEFLESVRARGIKVLEGHAVAHGKNIPFLPMLEIFRAYYGLEDGDEPRTVREKIAGRLLLLDPAFRDVLPLIFERFGAADPDDPPPEMDPDARQKLIFSILQRVVQGEADPLVTIVEDLHWLDATSEAFIEQWVDAVPGSNNLLIVNFRPEFAAEWTQKSWYRQLPLAPLGPEAIQELLEDLLGNHSTTSGLANRIHNRTSGNPFFTEEVVQGLIESGALEGTRGAYRLTRDVERLEIPNTVNSLLASRIDRLGERDKHALQAAAIIGKEFSRPILTPVAELPDIDLDEALSILKGGEFIYEQALYPVAEYSFKHPLTQEVALGSQLHERKRRLHARAGQALEASLADKLDESAALIAYHWEEAGENAQAVRWHRRAAEWIVGNDPVQAVRHWQHVRALGSELLDDDDVAAHVARACRTILSLGGWRMGISADQVNEIANQGRSLAERVGDVSSQAVILAAHGARHGVGGRQDLYYKMAREALALLDDDWKLEERVYAWTSVGYSAWCCGRTVEALSAFEQVESLSEGNPNVGFGLSGFSAWTWSAHMQSFALGYLGRLDEVEPAVGAAIALARKYNQTENLGWALLCRANSWLAAGSVPESSPDPREAALEAMEIALEVGGSYSTVVANANLGHAHLMMGDFTEAVKAERIALGLMKESRTALEMTSAALSTLSEALRELGDYSEAVDTARRAVEVAEQQPCIADGIRAQTVLGQALIALSENGGPDPRDEVETCLVGAKKWLEESGAYGMAPRIAELEQRLSSL
jgi:class 3 adenylate cyclase/tetratricopeptide (TPR) repeat protein